MKLDLSGQRAVVTGGARGIGLAIATALSQAGATVHTVDIASPENKGAVKFHRADITCRDDVQRLAGAIGGPVSVLVNNAGITRDRTLLKMSEREWRDVIDVNLTGAFHMLQAFAPLMNGGAIINITSINGIRGKFGQGNYAASKAGLIGLTRTAARELGRKGITVNAVAPGMVMTEMARSLPQEILDNALRETVLNRLAEPQDIANAVVFLASPAARFITGQVLNVDSGQLI